jgi:hypothetical protein
MQLKLIATLTAAAALCVAVIATAQPTPSQNARLKIAPNVTLQNLRAAPSNSAVETRKGTVVQAQRFVAVADAIRAAQSKPRTTSPAGFSRTAGAPALVLRQGSHMTSVLARPDSDVVQLPNGTKLTVGDIRKLQQIAPQMRGQSLPTSARADLQGSATRVTNARDLASLRNAPDNTVVENPNGIRVTLGELRTEARKQQR